MVNTGPEGCWIAAIILAIIGAVASIAGIAALLWWLFTHLHWA